MFDIEMLPAYEGDCLWIRYGEVASPRQILIDGGRIGTYQHIKARLSALPEDQREFELLVITHIDRDHIEGVLALLEDPELGLTFKDVWFNGYQHLKADALESFGAVQGERLSAALLSRQDHWNAAFGGGPIRVAADGELPRIRLDGGMEVLVLSPDAKQLSLLQSKWEAECKRAGIEPGQDGQRSEPAGLERFGGMLDVERLAQHPFTPDRALPNGSSIALLLTFEGVSALLAADAHVDRLIRSLSSVREGTGRVRLDAFKLSHHGSSGNTSRELVELVDCSRYLISTDGSYFRHPDETAIARVIKFGGSGNSLHFNYDTDFTAVWRDSDLQTKYDYTTVFPPEGQCGLIVSLRE
ncbi:hypothetical protein HKK60_01300 [Stenotrophomonas maltophilia]|uniref:hypothetical protein n=1 Tax=Stenotrophomonas maltophilia TaxID=40324 RepID=UPI00146330A0|nr:hypothetical protein [Stenotrophomonas maltophilia]QJP18224.1 hypothetical protein HKK60_01300 [Stenotrophomonas maltophilia]